MTDKIKVFTVDDSPVYRQVLREIISSDKELEYSGYASNGAIALQKLKLIKPDIITLDIQMPEMDGIETLKHIMKDFPTPVIMISSFTKDGADITFKALEIGAVDFIQKPASKNLTENILALEDVLLSKIKIFSNLKFNKNNHSYHEKEDKNEFPIFGGLSSIELPKLKSKYIDIIAIGSSTGGTIALSNILPKIRRNIGVPIVIVQHMPRLYTGSFSRRLDSLCSLKVVEAKHGEKVQPNTVYIAQGGLHMLIKDQRIELNNSENINHHKPSVDILFNSVAEEYRERVMGIILTGMGSDGANGIENIKDLGGYTVAQDQASSVIFGMPGSAIKTGKVDRIISLHNIADFVNDYVRNLSR